MKKTNDFTQQDAMEELSEAYACAVAAEARLDFMCAGKDRSSVDRILRCHGFPSADAIFPNSQLEIQLKATTRIRVKDGSTHFSFPLPRKNYDDLRRRSMWPMLLVILLLPKEKAARLVITADALLLSRCAYWCRLTGLPDVNNTHTVTVHVPIKNRFTPAVVSKMIRKAAKAESFDNDLEP